MKKEEITKKDAVLCRTKLEFNRIIELFKMDNEYLNYDIYYEDTVLFPLRGQYGDLNGFAKDKGFNIILSTEI